MSEVDIRRNTEAPIFITQPRLRFAEGSSTACLGSPSDLRYNRQFISAQSSYTHEYDTVTSSATEHMAHIYENRCQTVISVYELWLTSITSQSPWWYGACAQETAFGVSSVSIEKTQICSGETCELKLRAEGALRRAPSFITATNGPADIAEIRGDLHAIIVERLVLHISSVLASTSCVRLLTFQYVRSLAI
jgi:hypothetical protein